MKKGTLWFLVLVVGLTFAASAMAQEDKADYKIKIGSKEVGKGKIRIETQGDKETVTIEYSYEVGKDNYKLRQTAIYKDKIIQEFTSEFKENETVKSVVGQLKGEDYVIFVGGDRVEYPVSQIKGFTLDLYAGFIPEKTGKLTILDLVIGKIVVRDIKKDGNAYSWVFPEGWKRDKARYNPPSRLPVQINLKRGSEKDNYDLVFERIWK